MLTAFATDIWLADGGVVEVLGFRYPTQMAVIRLASGRLVLWSPVALTPTLLSEVTALGPVAAIIAPNHLHHLFIAEWQTALPKAQVFAAPGLRRKRPDLTGLSDLTDAAPPLWAEDIAQVLVHGNRITTEAVFFHRASGSVLFTDLMQQFPPEWFSGWRGTVARLDAMTGDTPQVPRKFRIAFTDRKAARAALTEILSWPATALIVAHGAPVTENAHRTLKDAWRFLMK